jgi:hypothetical protein
MYLKHFMPMSKDKISFHFMNNNRVRLGFFDAWLAKINRTLTSRNGLSIEIRCRDLSPRNISINVDYH